MDDTFTFAVVHNSSNVCLRNSARFSKGHSASSSQVALPGKIRDIERKQFPTARDIVLIREGEKRDALDSGVAAVQQVKVAEKTATAAGPA